ncbi:unnamed protein product, partial [Prorocentrum cordatum]
GAEGWGPGLWSCMFARLHFLLQRRSSGSSLVCSGPDVGGPHRRESVPAVQRSPSGSSLGAALYRRGDLVEYHSSSHKEWLPAVVNSVNDAGDIVIDLKPNTWIPRQELSGKIRRRRKASLPGAGGYASGAPPARAPSPRRDVAAGRPRVPLARAPSPLRCGGMAVVGS